MIFMKPTGCQVTAPASISCAISADAVLVGGRNWFCNNKNRNLMQTQIFTVCTRFLSYIIGGEFMKKSFASTAVGVSSVDGYNISWFYVYFLTKLWILSVYFVKKLCTDTFLYASAFFFLAIITLWTTKKENPFQILSLRFANTLAAVPNQPIWYLPLFLPLPGLPS